MGEFVGTRSNPHKFVQHHEESNKVFHVEEEIFVRHLLATVTFRLTRFDAFDSVISRHRHQHETGAPVFHRLNDTDA